MVTNLLDTLLSKERIFVVGSGGVGKTTLSAALAVAAAVERPINVLVVTVDPAKRLAGTLGVDALANSPRRVELPELNPKGELWAASVDMKSAWDDLVQQFSPDLATSERILASPIYHNLSAKFIGSYDYAAVQVLAALTADERYDLVIVDTPPSRNALDFLDAPARLREFFSSPLLALLTLPRRTRLFSAATRPFYLVADMVLGSAFLTDVTDFFADFAKLAPGLVEQSRSFSELLTASATGFIAIAAPYGPSVDEAHHLLEALKTRNLNALAFIINRALPGWLFTPEATKARVWLEEEAPAVLDARLAHDPKMAAAIHRATSELAFTYLQFVNAHARELLDALRDVGIDLFEVPIAEFELDSPTALSALVASTTMVASRVG
ncbi:ArsA family ATPase [Ferrimicrobium acidiphilum]|uniref:Anion-transporting ATPase n=2 Tax=Ferrimicrobium acidiphilum TaxID=121039 RepID=A0A0D8FVU0_9ACTN|nr:ArsA-related P-loop ATPase [Ferrimicrobium acidiphilum]KJE76367.1 anion-transporting ATPase [Ferrimicrobium acidiphilum DSM 19497]MCL5052585.1 AAA family ATPase [Gammaproteobacteria bacterium]